MKWLLNSVERLKWSIPAPFLFHRSRLDAFFSWPRWSQSFAGQATKKCRWCFIKVFKSIHRTYLFEWYLILKIDIGSKHCDTKTGQARTQTKSRVAQQQRRRQWENMAVLRLLLQPQLSINDQVRYYCNWMILFCLNHSHKVFSSLYTGEMTVMPILDDSKARVKGILDTATSIPTRYSRISIVSVVWYYMNEYQRKRSRFL